MRASRVCRMALVLAACLFLPACGGRKVSKSNYDKINTGMTEAEVEAILGPGDEQASMGVEIPDMTVGGGTVDGVKIPEVKAQGMKMTGKQKVWKAGTRIITVQFLNGKVSVKAQHGL